MASVFDDVTDERLANMDVCGKGLLYGILLNAVNLGIGATKIKKAPIGIAYLIIDDVIGYAVDDPALVRLRNELLDQANRDRYGRLAAIFSLETVVVWEGGTEIPIPISFPTQKPLSKLKK